MQNNFNIENKPGDLWRLLLWLRFSDSFEKTLSCSSESSGLRGRLLALLSVKKLNFRKLNKIFLIARLARSDPRNSFSACWPFAFSCAICSNFRVFHHVLISSLDMFKNCINSYHIDSEQVESCLRIISIVTILILNKLT